MGFRDLAPGFRAYRALGVSGLGPWSFVGFAAAAAAQSSVLEKVLEARTGQGSRSRRKIIFMTTAGLGEHPKMQPSPRPKTIHTLKQA